MSEFDPTDNTTYELNKDLIKEHDIYSTWKQKRNSKQTPEYLELSKKTTWMVFGNMNQIGGGGTTPHLHARSYTDC